MALIDTFPNPNKKGTMRLKLLAQNLHHFVQKLANQILQQLE